MQADLYRLPVLHFTPLQWLVNDMHAVVMDTAHLFQKEAMVLEPRKASLQMRIKYKLCG